MTKAKTFNVNPARELVGSLAVGLAVGCAAALTALPALWGPLKWQMAELVRIAGATGIVSGAPVQQPTPPSPIWSPLESLPIALGDPVFPTAALATVAASILIALCLHASSAAHLHNGTWVGGRRAPGSAVHGDARLVSRPGELKRLSHAWVKGGKPKHGTLAVGEIGASIRLIDSIHACVLAESGEGKSRRIAALTCLANFLQGRSLIINDIKGELRAWLEPRFRAEGTHRIIDVRFDAPGASARFDPLEIAKTAYARGGAGEATRELRELARCIVPKDSRSNPFFADGARNLFVGIALHVVKSPDIPEGQRTIMSVAAAMAPLGGRGPLDRIADLAASLEPGDPSLTFLGGLNGEHGGGPGIVSTLSNALAEYADGNVARMLYGDECRLDLIGEEPTVVFVSSSSATGDYKRLVQTFVAQSLSALRSTAARHAGKCPVESVLVLDEAASLGRNERIIQDLGEMRSEGVHVIWFCQSLLQLQSVSGYTREEAETILDLLKDKVVLSCSNLDTARKLSESMGSYTALARSTSRTKGVNTGSSGTSEAMVRRPLITPDELQRWTGRETGALVIHDGVPMAFPSRDITETFVGAELGMTSPDAERRLMEKALAALAVRNAEVPDTWRGVRGDGGPLQAKGAREHYTPEGF